jgi:hypothetical protein
VRNARDLRHCFRTIGGTDNTNTLSLACPAGSLAIADVVSDTDTATFTWTSLTEDVDADAGSSRVSSAHLVTPTSADTILAVSATPSAGALQAPVAVTVHPKTGATVVSGGWIVSEFNFNISSPAVTYSSPLLTNKSTHGTFKLLVGLMGDSDIAINSMTINGAAMSRIGQATNTASSPDIRLEFWAIDIVNGSPSGNIVVTYASTNTTTELSLLTWHLYNVGNVGTAQAITGNGTGSALSVPVSAGGAIIAMNCQTVAQGTTRTVTWTSGMTPIIDGQVESSGLYLASTAEKFLCSSGTQTVQAVSSLSGQYSTLAIAFNP